MLTLSNATRSATAELLQQAVHRNSVFSLDGLRERAFTRAFQNLVYPQIWEDPVVDLEALSSAGQPLRRYRVGRLQRAELPRRRSPLDHRGRPQPAHVALNRLKLAAARHLPDYARFYALLRRRQRRRNVEPTSRSFAPQLDDATRSYWEARDRFGRRRIGYFGATSIATACSAASSAPGICWRALRRRSAPACCGARTARSSAASSSASWRRCSEQPARPLAARQRRLAVRPRHPARAVSRARRRRPGGMAERAAAAAGATRLRLRPRGQLFRLAGLRPPLCHGRPRRRCRPICSARTFARSAQARGRVAVRARIPHRASGARSRRGSVDRYVLLDAQDWMTRRAAQRAVERDHAHRRARRARDLPHRRRADASCPAASPTRPARATGGYRGRRSRASPAATARRSTAASTST